MACRGAVDAARCGRMMRSWPYRPVFTHRIVRRVLPGFTVSSIGDGMSLVAVSWLAIELAPAAHRGTWVAMAVAAYTLPGAAGALLLGRLLRSRDPARLVRWDALLRALALGAIPLAHAIGVLSIGLYVALLATSAVLHSWGRAGVYTAFAQLLPNRDHLAGNAVLSTINSLSTIIGPALAGPLIAWIGAPTVIAIDAATFLVLAASFRFTIPIRDGPGPNVDTTPGTGRFGFVRRHPALIGLLALSFAYFFLFGPVYVALPLHVTDDPHGSAALLSAFYTAFGIGAVVGAVLAGHLNRWPLWPTLIGIIICFGGFMLPLGLGAVPAIALPAFALAALLWPPYQSMSITLIQRTTSGSTLSQALAAHSAIGVLAVPLGSALGGPLVSAFGAEQTLQLCAIATTADRKSVV